MEYFGMVYRPPSEARSLIIQATVGCSYNKCDFCSMYKDDQFTIRPIEDVLADLKEMSEIRPFFKRIFLADGDALVLKTEDLISILDYAYEVFPALERVTAYATVNDLLRKPDEDLKLIREKGLEMLYIGLESGSDEILKSMNKDMPVSDYLKAIEKAHKAGFKTSVTVLDGLGGEDGMFENALETAKAISASKPTYLSYLSLQVHEGTPLADRQARGEFQLPDAVGFLEEIKVFLQNVDSEGTIFRSNHASNYLNLKGNLNEDNERMIVEIDQAIVDKDFMPDYLRGF